MDLFLIARHEIGHYAAWWLIFVSIAFCSARYLGWVGIFVGAAVLTIFVILIDVRWIFDDMQQHPGNGRDADLVFWFGVLCWIALFNAVLLPVYIAGLRIRKRHRHVTQHIAFYRGQRRRPMNKAPHKILHGVRNPALISSAALALPLLVAGTFRALIETAFGHYELYTYTLWRGIPFHFIRRFEFGERDRFFSTAYLGDALFWLGLILALRYWLGVRRRHRQFGRRNE